MEIPTRFERAAMLREAIRRRKADDLGRAQYVNDGG